MCNTARTPHSNKMSSGLPQIHALIAELARPAAHEVLTMEVTATINDDAEEYVYKIEHDGTAVRITLLEPGKAPKVIQKAVDPGWTRRWLEFYRKTVNTLAGCRCVVDLPRDMVGGIEFADLMRDEPQQKALIDLFFDYR